MHLNQNVNQKKLLKREERKEIKQTIGPFSLSRTFQKKVYKQNKLCCFHICPGSSKNDFDNFWISNKKGFSIVQMKSIIGIHLLPFPNGFEIILKLQNKHMESFPIKLGNQQYTLDHFLKWLSTPNNCFAKYYLNRHHLAFNQMHLKVFRNSKPIVWLDAILNKFYNNTNFIIF